ncbi:MAG: FAD synthetase family protein, partial [archaeon]|nr:FAD synthetase family protein [archaeon]
MELIENLDQINGPFKNAVFTTGNFDGVHKGHQSLCRQVIKKAKEINGTSIAMIFDPHPLKTLGKSSPAPITKRDQKIELIEQTGIDILLCIQFDKVFATISAIDFIQNILINKIGIKAIITGADYLFGKNRTGNIELLKEQGRKFGFETIISDWTTDQDDNNKRISSTRIREIVMEGKVDQAM